MGGCAGLGDVGRRERGEEGRCGLAPIEVIPKEFAVVLQKLFYMNLCGSV